MNKTGCRQESCVSSNEQKYHIKFIETFNDQTIHRLAMYYISVTRSLVFE